jgi:hypothetical protein
MHVLNRACDRARVVSAAMSFDDVAKRMRERHTDVNPLDPDRMLVEGAREERRSAAMGEIVIGIVLLVLGIAITGFTYDSASRSGGTYIVAYGPIIVGVIKLIRGMVRLGS